MPQPCCPSPVNPCIDPASPITNYSSEGPDPFIFPEVWHPDPPPLDGGPPTIVVDPCFGSCDPQPPESPCAISPWESNGTVFATSVESEQDALLQARNKYIDCIDSWSPPPFGGTPPPRGPTIDQPPGTPNPPTVEDGGNGGGQPPRPRQKKCNDQQFSCQVPCGQYGKFSYTLLSQKVCAFTLEEANATAKSLACQYALQKRFCLPALSPIAWCVGNPYEALINPQQGKLKAIGREGGLPTGLTSEFINDELILISGTPAVPGEFCFTLWAAKGELLNEPPFPGVFYSEVSERRYCILIFDIDCPAATATAGQDYADLIALLGPINRVTNLTCSIIEGSLPPGLSLNAKTCMISGHVPLSATPGIYEFTVEACFTAMIQGQTESVCCHKVCSITLGSPTCPDWTDPASFSWGPFTKDVHGAGTDATGTISFNQATINAYTGGGPPPDEFWVTANYQNDFIYNGPGCGGKLRFNISISGVPPGAAASLFRITRPSDAAVILDTGLDGFATGNYTYNFTLDDTLGADVTYHFNFEVSAGNIGAGPPWEASNITALARLEWQ